MSIRLAYHEAGHALVALSFGARVKSVSFGPDGGFVRREPLTPGETPEEIERDLVIAFAGPEAERYAPQTWDQWNHGPWLTDGEERALQATPGTGDSPLSWELPSDKDVIEEYTKQLGDEFVERAREFAVELVDRAYRTGRLEKLADELFIRGDLTGEEIERLLAVRA